MNSLFTAWIAYPPALSRGFLQDGFDRPTARRTWDEFEVVCTALVIPGDDVDACADFVRPIISLYVGGMGAKGANFLKYSTVLRLGVRRTEQLGNSDWPLTLAFGWQNS